MRVKRHQLSNKMNPAIAVIIFILLIGLIPIRTVSAADLEVQVPYDQDWTNHSGRKVDNTFSYELTAADNSSPVPAESRGGTYAFSLKGTKHGQLRLHFAFYKPGYYHYNVTPKTSGLSNRYTYDPPDYDLMIMVVNSENGLEVGAMTIMDKDREARGDRSKYAALEYNASYSADPVQPGRQQPQQGGGPANGAGPVFGAQPGDGLPDDNPGDEEPDGVIEDEPVPQAPGDEEGIDYWALLNLILMILTVIIATCDGILYFKRPKEDKEAEQKGEVPEEEKWVKRYARRGLMRIIAIIIAIISIIVFFLTEDMRLPMEWVDEYTIWMFILFALAIIFAFLSRKTTTEDEEEGYIDAFDESAGAADDPGGSGNSAGKGGDGDP